MIVNMEEEPNQIVAGVVGGVVLVVLLALAWRRYRQWVAPGGNEYFEQGIISSGKIPKYNWRRMNYEIGNTGWSSLE